MKVGILDSGIGGLTILKALINKYNHHEYIYFGDTLHLPFGNKTKKEVITYGNKIIDFLEKQGADIIVIACGTLSSNVEYLHSNKPLIDIISPLANKLDDYKNISILATSLTVKTNAFKKYIHTNLNLIAAPKLVPMIEENKLEFIDKVLKKYLIKAKDSDALILGCTHYPLIIENIRKIFNKRIITLDEFVLDKINNLEKSNFAIKLYFSKIDDNIKYNAKRILGISKLKIERKDLND